MKVTVTQEVQVPPGLILYDVADEKIVCQCCRASKVWEIEGDRITSSAPPLNEFFKDFVQKHVACIPIFLEKEACIPIFLEKEDRSRQY